MALYGSSKAAMKLLMKAWAAEYGPKGVRVNAVSHGPTSMESTSAMAEGLEQIAAQAPEGRPAPADLGRPLSRRKPRRQQRLSLESRQFRSAGLASGFAGCEFSGSPRRPVGDPVG